MYKYNTDHSLSIAHSWLVYTKKNYDTAYTYTYNGIYPDENYSFSSRIFVYIFLYLFLLFLSVFFSLVSAVKTKSTFVKFGSAADQTKK